MKLQKIATTKKSFLVSIFVVFFLSFALAGTFAYASLEVTKDYEKDSTRKLTIVQAGKIQNVLDTKLSTAETIASVIKAQDDPSFDFDTLMQEFREIRKIDSISLAPNGVISETYPLEGNEATIGHDLLNDPNRAVEAKIALDSRKLTLSGPYFLRQGHEGAIGRLAIFMNDNKGQEYFWGFVCITLNFPEAFDDTEISKLKEQNYAYEIWRVSPETNKKESILKSGILEKSAVVESINVPNAKWFLSVYPRSGWIQTWDYILRYALALLFSTLITILYVYVRTLAHNRNELRISMEQQTENYLQMNRLNNKLRGFRHDMSNHMISISSLLAKKDVDSAQEYIENLNSTFLASSPITNTENYVFDALLAEKKKQAKEKGIEIECEIYLSRKLNIENIDWSTLFGNLLDNSIEAASNAGITKPVIRLHIFSKGNMMHVKLMNSCLKEPIIKNERFITTKENTNLHGQGMNHIRFVIKKYGGTMDTSYSNHEFTISFILYDV